MIKPLVEDSCQTSSYSGIKVGSLDSYKVTRGIESLVIQSKHHGQLNHAHKDLTLLGEVVKEYKREGKKGSEPALARDIFVPG